MANLATPARTVFEESPNGADLPAAGWPRLADGEKDQRDIEHGGRGRAGARKLGRERNGSMGNGRSVGDAKRAEADWPIETPRGRPPRPCRCPRCRQIRYASRPLPRAPPMSPDTRNNSRLAQIHHPLPNPNPSLHAQLPALPYPPGHHHPHPFEKRQLLPPLVPSSHFHTLFGFIRLSYNPSFLICFF